MTPAELARFHAGDDAVFRALIERHNARLYGLVRRYARDDDHAADLLQEVWVRIYRKRTRYAGGSFLAWSATLARHLCLNAVGARRAEPVPLDDAVTLGVAGADVPTDVPDTHGLTDALFTLSERQREVVIAHVVEGESVREVAARLGCAEGTVKATLHQALARLRKTLSGSVR